MYIPFAIIQISKEARDLQSRNKGGTYEYILFP